MDRRGAGGDPGGRDHEEDTDIDLFVIAVLAWVIGFGVGTAVLARRRDRLVPAWAFFGATLGPVALILLWVAPPGRCATCRASVRGWLTTCAWCGMDVRGIAPESFGHPAPVAAVASPAPVPAPAPAPAPAKASGKKGAARPTISVAPTRRPTDPTPATPPATKAKAAPKTPRKRSAATAEASAPLQVVTTGIYMTGTVGLSAGSRYSIQMDDTRLVIVGPSDRNSKAIAYERPLADIEATGMEGRLILTSPGGRGGTVLVFTSIDGGDPATVARSIGNAAQAVAS